MRSLPERLLCVRTTSSTIPPGGGGTERSEVPEKYRWDLTDLYPTAEAWIAAKDTLIARVRELARFQGQLGKSPDSLFAALSYQMDLDRDLSQLCTYASLLYDQDTRVAKNLEMHQGAEQLAVQYHAVAAYVRPEIAAIGAATIHAFIASDARLSQYRSYLDDILRWAPHTLSPLEEKIAAQAGRFSEAGASIWGQFVNAEMPYAKVLLSTGKTVHLDGAAYTHARALPNRADRMTVFQVFWSKYREFQGTLGAALNAQVQAHLFHNDVHKFESSLAASLFRDNIPATIYRQLLDNVHANLGTLHRYLRLRRRMMKLETLRYEDIYAPIVSEVNLNFSPEEATTLVLESLAALGDDYVCILRRGFASRWIDWLPTRGKASGAYTNAAYRVHPYQLQNFTGLYEDVSTLAHEAGHSMHTYLSDQHQPYVTHDYAIFVAEVASTLNENLLLHSVLERTQDRAFRLFLLGSYLDNLRGTLFQQTLLAEFELLIHEIAERGETLTGENLSELYLRLLRTYYGHDEGICEIDALYGVGWAHIDHFFDDFYVYQYATSIVASTVIANAIRDEAKAKGPLQATRDAYLKLLQSGSSEYPIELLRDAGVDMTTPAPFQTAMREMNVVIDQIETLVP